VIPALRSSIASKSLKQLLLFLALHLRLYHCTTTSTSTDHVDQAITTCSPSNRTPTSNCHLPTRGTPLPTPTVPSHSRGNPSDRSDTTVEDGISATLTVNQHGVEVSEARETVSSLSTCLRAGKPPEYDFAYRISKHDLPCCAPWRTETATETPANQKGRRSASMTAIPSIATIRNSKGNMLPINTARGQQSTTLEEEAVFMREFRLPKLFTSPTVRHHLRN
jgi:hypothetical protein